MRSPLGGIEGRGGPMGVSGAWVSTKACEFLIYPGSIRPHVDHVEGVFVIRLEEIYQ